MAIADFQDYLSLIPAVHRAPQHAVWLTYDDEADTLYVNFQKPSHATDSELTDEDVIIRYTGSEVIGFTILHARNTDNAVTLRQPLVLLRLKGVGGLDFNQFLTLCRRVIRAVATKDISVGRSD